MDPLSILSLVLGGISIVSTVIESIKKSNEIKDLKSEQLSEYEKAKKTLKEHWDDQEEIFNSQTQAFKSNQKMKIALSGVSAQSGSPLQAQIETARKIEEDRAAMAKQKELDFNALDVNQENAMAELDRAMYETQQAPLWTILGKASEGVQLAAAGSTFSQPAGTADITGYDLGLQLPYNMQNLQQTQQPYGYWQFGTYGKKNTGIRNTGSGYNMSGFLGG